MADDRERPVTTREEIDRTGRDQQVAPDGKLGANRSEPGAAPGLAPDDAPGDGVASADFPGTAAP